MEYYYYLPKNAVGNFLVLKRGKLIRFVNKRNDRKRFRKLLCYF